MDNETMSMIIVLPTFFMASAWGFKTMLFRARKRLADELHSRGLRPGVEGS